MQERCTCQQDKNKNNFLHLILYFLTANQIRTPNKECDSHNGLKYRAVMMPMLTKPIQAAIIKDASNDKLD